MSGESRVILAGAVAGMCEGVTVQPLEMVKTRLQIHAGERLGMGATMCAIVRDEGGLRQLYRGGLPEIAGLMPRSAAMWSGYELARRKLTAANGGVCSTPIVAASGVVAGVCEALAFSPFQVVKVRLMAVEHLGRYAHTVDCVRQIIRQEGLAALTIGLGPTLCRNCVWDAIFLSGMYNIDQRVSKPEGVLPRALQELTLGTAVGMFATCFNTPFDVVKSRMQAQHPDAPQPWAGTINSLRRIVAEEGVSQVYRGFTPKALRLGLGQTIGLMCFQALLPPSA